MAKQMSVFDGDKELSQEEIENLVLDEIRRRATPNEVITGGALVTLGGNEARRNIHQQLGKGIRDEYQDIRSDPERQARQMDEMKGRNVLVEKTTTR